MKTRMFIFALVAGFSFLTSDIWGTPREDQPIPFRSEVAIDICQCPDNIWGTPQEDQLIPFRSEVAIDTCQCPSDEPIVRKVHRGKEFDIVLHMWYWKFKESYGLTYRTSWYKDYTTIFRFRVDSWYIGNELLLTFTRGDGLVVKYLIVNAEAN